MSDFESVHHQSFNQTSFDNYILKLKNNYLIIYKNKLIVMVKSTWSGKGLGTFNLSNACICENFFSGFFLPRGRMHYSHVFERKTL